MTIYIRPPAEDELRAAMTASEIAFGSGGIEDEDWERESKALPASRALAAFDAGKPVALAGAYKFDLTVPGGQLPCAGVTWVGVMPTHRRRGILRDFMRQQLEDVHELGRADRGALGLRGVDLRPLRLRAGGPERAHEVGLARASRCARTRPGAVRLVDADEGARALLAGLRARARRSRRDALARRALVEGAPPRRPGELAPRREQEVLRRRRDRRSRRGLRALPRQGRVGGRLRPTARCA